MAIGLSMELAEVILVAIFIAVALVALHRWGPRPIRVYRPGRNAFLWLVVGVLLVKITEDVLGQETGTGDEALLQWIHSEAPVAWCVALQQVTDTASFVSIMAIAALGAALLHWRGLRYDALALALTPVVAGLVIYLAKAFVQRERPALWEADVYWGTSFPSGHTLGAAALATVIGLLASRIKSRAGRWLLRGWLVTWVVLVGFSRMYLGVHWPTDVAAAACAGAIVAVIVHGTVARWSPRNALVAAAGRKR